MNIKSSKWILQFNTTKSIPTLIRGDDAANLP